MNNNIYDNFDSFIRELELNAESSLRRHLENASDGGNLRLLEHDMGSVREALSGGWSSFLRRYVEDRQLRCNLLASSLKQVGEELKPVYFSHINEEDYVMRILHEASRKLFRIVIPGLTPNGIHI